MPPTPTAPHKIFFETLGNTARFQILQLLYKKRGLPATEIANALKLEQSLASHNLRRLEQCGFVICIRRGKQRIYALNTETIRPLLALMDRHLKKFCCHLCKNETIKSLALSR